MSSEQTNLKLVGRKSETTTQVAIVAESHFLVNKWYKRIFKNPHNLRAKQKFLVVLLQFYAVFILEIMRKLEFCYTCSLYYFTEHNHGKFLFCSVLLPDDSFEDRTISSCYQFISLCQVQRSRDIIRNSKMF